MAAWLDTSLETGACSDLILDWRDGGKQPSTRSVTFQHSALRSWFEEPDDKKAKASVCSGNDTPDAEDNDIESLVSLGSFGQGCNTEQNSAWDKIHE